MNTVFYLTLCYRKRGNISFSILSGVRKGNSKTATLDFRGADLELFRKLVERVPLGFSLRE